MLDPAGAQGHHPRRRQGAGLRARLRTGRGSGAAGRGLGPRRMAGRDDGLVRAGISGDPGRGDPRHHPQQPEVLRRSGIPRPASSTNKFVLTANIEATDGGKTIVAGNERVIRARLSRREVLLRDRPEDASSKTGCRSSSRSCSTRSSAPRPRASSASSAWRPRSRRWSAPMSPRRQRAAHLAKADLLTEVVGEFPEVQGLMGKYYALAQGEDASVAAALRGALQAARPDRSRADRSGQRRGGACRQDRYAGRASGRSTRSRRAARTRMRCVARRWG